MGGGSPYPAGYPGNPNTGKGGPSAPQSPTPAVATKIPPEPGAPIPMSLRQAMARMEGWYAYGNTPNRPQRNNNPGDLEFCKETIEAGAIDGDPRFAIFRTPADGWEAFRLWLSVPAQFDAAGTLIEGYRGAKLSQVIARFAPPSENDTTNYRLGVYAFCELTPETVVTQEIIDNFVVIPPAEE